MAWVMRMGLPGGRAAIARGDGQGRGRSRSRSAGRPPRPTEIERSATAAAFHRFNSIESNFTGGLRGQDFLSLFEPQRDCLRMGGSFVTFYLLLVNCNRISSFDSLFSPIKFSNGSDGQRRESWLDPAWRWPLFFICSNHCQVFQKLA